MFEVRGRPRERSEDLRTTDSRITSMNRRSFLVAAAAFPVSLAIPRRVRAGGIPDLPFALVTADLDAHVCAVDLVTGRILGRIPTELGPRSIEAVGGGSALVAHTEIGRISVIDARSLSVRAVLDGFEAPRYAAAHPTRALVYVTDSAREEVAVVESAGARVLWRTRVPGPARHVSISADGRTMWIALGTKAARVAVLDTSAPRRPRLIRTFAAPFLAHDVVFAPDGRTAWVTSGDEPRIALYRDGRLNRIVPGGAAPQHVTFARAKAFVASGDDGTLRRYRLDGTLVRESRVPAGSYNVSFGLGNVVSPSLSAGTLALLDSNGRVRAVRKVARAAHDACVVDR